MTGSLAEFPGEKSPGLIEASRQPIDRRDRCPARFPGEKSPGLIEAGSTCSSCR